MKKLFVISLLLSVLLFQGAFSDDIDLGSKQKLAERFLKAFGINDFWEEVLRQKRIQFQKNEESYSKEYQDLFFKNLKFDDFQKIFTDLFANNFSIEQLQELSKFFNSPVGIKSKKAIVNIVQGKEIEFEELNFSENDLSEFLQFFQSELGNDFIGKMPQLTSASQNRAQELMNQIELSIQADLNSNK